MQGVIKFLYITPPSNISCWLKQFQVLKKKMVLDKFHDYVDQVLECKIKVVFSYLF